MRPGDPMPDTRPYTLAAAYLWDRGYAEVTWATDATGLEQVQAVRVQKLRHWREDFFAFEECVYRRIVQEELSADLTGFLNGLTYFGERNRQVHLRVTRGVQGDVVAQLRCLCQVVTEQMPAWIGERHGGDDLPDPRRVVAFENGLLDVDAWLGDPLLGLAASTPDWFSEAVLPCRFDPKATCPTWTGFLGRSLGDDGELVRLLQEFFGYCLTGDTTLEKLLWLHGVSRGGKSTVVRMLRRVVGERNTVSFDLWSLLGNFTLSAFLGKRLATSADAHLGNSSEADKVLAKLKGISGQDEQLVDRKNREMLSSVHLSVRFVISTNEFPTLPDASDALANRALFIPFERSFFGEENTGLSADLEAELAGVTVWALDGLRRLLANHGKFTTSEAARRVAQEFRRQQSPVHAFAEDWLVEADYMPHQRAGGIPAKGTIPADHLYDAYVSWSDKNRRKALGLAKFGEKFKRAMPKVTRGHPRDDDGNPYWEYRGLTFSLLGINEFVHKEVATYGATG